MARKQNQHFPEPSRPLDWSMNWSAGEAQALPFCKKRAGSSRTGLFQSCSRGSSQPWSHPGCWCRDAALQCPSCAIAPSITSQLSQCDSREENSAWHSSRDHLWVQLLFVITAKPCCPLPLHLSWLYPSQNHTSEATAQQLSGNNAAPVWIKPPCAIIKTAEREGTDINFALQETKSRQLTIKY